MEVGLHITPYNAKLRRARRRAGLTQAQVALAVGIKQPIYSEIELLRRNVTPDLAHSIALELGEDPNEIFPEQTYRVGKGKRGSFDISVHVESLDNIGPADFALPSSEDEAMRAMVRYSLEEAIEELSEREAYVIKELFGFNEASQGSSFSEVAKSMGLTRMRVIQIRQYALKKLGRRNKIRKYVLPEHLDKWQS